MKLYELLSNFSYELYKNRDDVIKFIQSVERVACKKSTLVIYS